MPMVSGGHGARDLAGQRVRNRLEHDGVGARVAERARVVEDARALLVGAALQLEAAELVHRLRRQADVAHDRDARRARAGARARRPRRRPRA